MNHSNNKKNQIRQWGRTTLVMICACYALPSLAQTKLGYRIAPQPAAPSHSAYQSYDPTAWTSTRQNANAYGTPLPRPSYPNYQQPMPPHHGYHRPYPNYPQYPVQNGVTITYHQQLPSYTEYRSEQYGYVNGQNGSIQSTQTTYISDWRRYNLPAPAQGMHWIYENGRYLQVPNGR